jgi:hypothetical protein
MTLGHGSALAQDATPQQGPLCGRGAQLPLLRCGNEVRCAAVRHFWATRFAASGGSTPELMAAGGWSTPRMTSRYAKAGRRLLAAATARMEAFEARQREALAQPAHSPAEQTERAAG